MHGAAEPLGAYPNIKRRFASVNARPAVAPARAVGTDHAFKTERDKQALRALFPSNYPRTA
jgi:GST-like protein